MQNTTNLAGECEELAPTPPFVLSRFACAYCGTILVKTQHFLRQLNVELKRVEKTSTS